MATTFLIDEKYRLIENAETKGLVESLIKGDSPRIFSVTNK